MEELRQIQASHADAQRIARLGSYDWERPAKRRTDGYASHEPPP